MRAAIFHDYGGPEVVRIEDVARPVPAPDEVLIEVRAASMNHLDLWVRRGIPIETTMPHIGGSDVAGMVAESGSAAEGFGPGDRVLVNPNLSCGRCEWCERGETPLCREYRILGEHTQGGFAEFVAAPARNLVRLPDDYTYEDAAAAPLVFMTAWRALMTQGRLEAGQTVLITGASGGVATAAIQIAKLAGATVYALTSSPYMERVATLRADVVLDRTQADYAREIWNRTNKRGVDVVLDSVGAATFTSSFRCLARGGRMIVYGATTGPSAQLDLRHVFWKQVALVGSTMATDDEFAQVIRLVLDGRLRPVVDVVWPLGRAREAHERLEAGQAFGKVVLTP